MKKMNQKEIEKTMNYVAEFVNGAKSVLVPLELVAPVYDAACAFGYAVNGGAFGLDANGVPTGQFLYVETLG